MLPSSLSRSVNTTRACPHWNSNRDSEVVTDASLAGPMKQAWRRELGRLWPLECGQIVFRAPPPWGVRLNFLSEKWPSTWTLGQQRSSVWSQTGAVAGHTFAEWSFRNGEAPHDLECDANSAVGQPPQTVTFLELNSQWINSYVSSGEIVSCNGPNPVVEL